MPITPVRQTDVNPKRVFVLGVYASAVHARWVADNGKTIINAIAVSSEPEIFWRGNGADALIERVAIPPGAGRLVAANKTLNGPSGVTLDSMFLEPLGINRGEAWLCDLLPESRCNPKQRAAVEREYDSRQERLGLPAYDFPPVPSVLASATRRIEIEREILAALPEILVTLGDQRLHGTSQGRAETIGLGPAACHAWCGRLGAILGTSRDAATTREGWACSSLQARRWTDWRLIRDF